MFFHGRLIHSHGFHTHTHDRGDPPRSQIPGPCHGRWVDLTHCAALQARSSACRSTCSSLIVVGAQQCLIKTAQRPRRQISPLISAWIVLFTDFYAYRFLMIVLDLSCGIWDLIMSSIGSPCRGTTLRRLMPRSQHCSRLLLAIKRS